MKAYHIGFIKGSGNCYPLHYNGHRETTLVIQARRCIDNLSCTLWKYIGERITTKQELNKNKLKILAQVNQVNNTSFTHIVIE